MLRLWFGSLCTNKSRRKLTSYCKWCGRWGKCTALAHMNSGYSKIPVGSKEEPVFEVSLRCHCWLMSNFSSIRTPKFFFTGLFPVSYFPSLHSYCLLGCQVQHLAFGLAKHHYILISLFKHVQISLVSFLLLYQPHHSAWCHQPICWGYTQSHCVTDKVAKEHWSTGPWMDPWGRALVNGLYLDTEPLAPLATILWLWPSSQFFIHWIV